MTSIESRSGVVGVLDLIPSGRQTRIRAEVVLSRRGAEPRAVEMPRDPVRNAAVAMIRHYVLALGQKIVCRVCYVCCRVRRIAHREVYLGIAGTTYGKTDRRIRGAGLSVADRNRQDFGTRWGVGR